MHQVHLGPALHKRACGMRCVSEAGYLLLPEEGSLASMLFSKYLKFSSEFIGDTLYHLLY